MPVVATWGQTFSSWGRNDGDRNAAGLNRSTDGLLVGVDHSVEKSWRFGLAGGYGRTALDVDQRASSASIDSYHLIGYGGFNVDGFAVRAGTAYTWHDVETSRGIAFRQLRDTASAVYGARTAQLFGEAGYALTSEFVALEPFAAFAHVEPRTAHLVEHAAAASLTRLMDRASVNYSTLGLRAAALLLATDATSVTARGSLGWRHAFGDARPSFAAEFHERWHGALCHRGPPYRAGQPGRRGGAGYENCSDSLDWHPLFGCARARRARPRRPDQSNNAILSILIAAMGRFSRPAMAPRLLPSPPPPGCGPPQSRTSDCRTVPPMGPCRA